MMAAACILLALGVVAFLISPLLDNTRRLSGGRQEMEDLVKRKEFIYSAIRELNIDYNMGKLSPEDHRQLQNEYMQEASVVLDRIERSANGKHQIGAQIEQAVLEIRKRRVVAGSQGTGSPAPVTVSSPVSAQKSACPSCGAENPEEANFCNECGVSLRQTVACGACGAENRSGARFCGQCGQKMA